MPDGAFPLTDLAPAAALLRPERYPTEAEHEGAQGVEAPPGTEVEADLPGASRPQPRPAAVRESLLPTPAPDPNRPELRDPESPQGTQARERAAAVAEEKAYLRALARNDAPGYREFLDQFPTSLRTREVEARLRATKRAP